MNNSIGSIVFLVIALILGMFLTQSIVEDSNLVLTVVLGGGVAALFLWKWLAPSLPFDAWILLVALGAYLISAKGFAYLNVGGLIFPAEVVLFVCGLSYLGRVISGQHSLFPATPITVPLMLLFVYGIARIFMFDWGRYGVMALRDFCVIYYFLFAFVSFQLTSCYPAFRAALTKTIVVYGLIAVLLEAVWANNPAFRGILTAWQVGQFNPLLPHGDASHGVWLGFILYGAMYENPSSGARVLWWRFMSALSLAYMVGLGRGACYVALFLMFVILLICGRLGTVVRRIGPLSIILVMVAYFGLWAVNGEDVIGKRVVSELNSMLVMERKQVVTEDDGNADWRLQWWTYIYNNVSRDNPLFGWGFGADISTKFHQWYLRTNDVGANWGRVRGAHNVLFTILARMGFSGVLLMIWVVWAQLNYFTRAVDFIRRREFPQDMWLLLGFLCFEFAVSFLQYAWEAPYSAVPFWVVAGAFYARVEMLRASRRANVASDAASASSSISHPGRFRPV